MNVKQSTSVTERGEKSQEELKAEPWTLVVVHIEEQGRPLTGQEMHVSLLHVLLLGNSKHIFTMKSPYQTFGCNAMLPLVAGILQYYIETVYPDSDPMVKAINEAIRKRLDDVLLKLIEERLERYDADKTGKPDFALEKSGGTIIAVNNAAPLNKKYPKSSARFMIQECVHPAECWAFGGAKASVTIRLRQAIFVQGVTLEHIHINQSFTGDLSSAPKDFMILGMEKPNEVGCPLGQFEYNINGKPLQYFEIKGNSTKPYEYVQFQVLSNHGNLEYTCIYRLRVHGKVPNDANLNKSFGAQQ